MCFVVIQKMELPQKTRVIQSFLQDSEKWEHFKMRDDDIVVATSYKCGTTWMQNM